MASARRLAFGGWDNTRHFYCGSTILAPRGAVPCPGDRQETARALPYVRVSVGEKKVTDFPEISRKFEGLRLELVSINFALVQQKSVPGPSRNSASPEARSNASVLFTGTIQDIGKL